MTEKKYEYIVGIMQKGGPIKFLDLVNTFHDRILLPTYSLQADNLQEFGVRNILH